MTFNVRSATESDLTTIAEFNRQLALETEAKQLDPAVLLAGVRRALASPTLCSYFIAEHEGNPVGQTMVTYELTDWRDGVFWWFQSVYVSVDFRRGESSERSLPTSRAGPSHNPTCGAYGSTSRVRTVAPSEPTPHLG